MTTRTAVVVYTHPDCHYSRKLKGELRAEGTPFEEINLSRRPEMWEEIERITGGERITPVMVRDGKVKHDFRNVGCVC
ncbi:MAG: glutaredoxin family protein [SAR202 cluster bacterium]|nr:glutaredoxin family protein [SAR202 cluster bacterium]